MKIVAQFTHCNNIVKILVKVPLMPPKAPIALSPKPQPSVPISKSVSYHNIYKNFNLEKYIEDEKKYIKKMVKYYNE
jgi:hypothetical protein